ncbi:MAG: sensor histidine kinase, partial [Spirochaetaceae bacterium]
VDGRREEPWEQLTVDTAVPLGLIATELISNAVKHGAPDGRGVRISVSFRRENTERVLTVADNGPGLPRGFEPARTGTLGTALVVSLCDQLGARSNWESDGGTRFTVTVPVSARHG